jgi:iron complex transport system ATP-binding protein
VSLLSGKAISFSAGEHTILENVDLELKPGELLGLIGPNGAGKSTLLKILTGLLQASQGEITIEGTPLKSIAGHILGRKLAYLAQDGSAHWPVQVERLVELGRIPHLGSWQHLGGEDLEAVEQAMRSTDILALRNRIFTTLSGGERMRVLLARALAVEPRIVLADEPVAALDPSHQLEVMELFRNHCNSGGAAIVVLHDLSLAAHFCNRLLLLDQGQKVADDIPSEVLTEQNLRSVYNIAYRPPSEGSPFQHPWKAADPKS